MPLSIEFNDWKVDYFNRKVISPLGVKIHCTNMEFEILMTLIANHDRVVSRDMMSQIVRNKDRHVEDRSIDVAISRLRKKLGGGGRKNSFIASVRNVGYRLFNTVVKFNNGDHNTDVVQWFLDRYRVVSSTQPILRVENNVEHSMDNQPSS